MKDDFMTNIPKNHKIDMCSGPILGKMLLFAMPLMLSGILQLLFNAADIIVVGRFAGDNSMAAVGSTTALINLLINLFVGISVGANVLAARFFASNREEDLSKTVQTSMIISVVGGIIMAAVGTLSAHTVLVMMSSPPEVINLATLYLRIYFLGMPANMIYNFGSALLRAVGDTRRPLYYLTVAGVVNVILNLVFVIRFNMNVAGVAIATVVSQFISAFLIVRCLMNESGGIKLVLSNIRPDKSKFLQIIGIGLPAGFQGVIFSLSNVVIQSSINSFGNIVVAGSAASANIENFVYVSMNSVYQATLSFCGQNTGVGNFARAKKITVIGVCLVSVVGAVLGNMSVAFSNTLLGLYSPNPEVVAQGYYRLRVIAGTYAICGAMDVMTGALRGMGYSIMPMLVSLIGACGLRLLWLATIFTLPQFHTAEIVYLSYPISWAVTFAVHVLCYMVVTKRAENRLNVQSL